MKLSMMTYTMSRRPELFDLEGMLQLTHDLKMDGIDWVRTYDRDPAELKRMCDDLGIPVVCHTFFAKLADADPSVREAALDDVKVGVEAAVTLGAPTVMLPTGCRKDIDRDSFRALWIEGLKRAAPVVQDAGLTLTVENFPGAASAFVIADDLLQAIEQVPGMKVTYDNGNAASGEEPARSFERVAPYVVHAHFKDWDVRDEPAEGYRQMLDGRYYRAALIGEGVVDHKAVLEAMTRSGYDGCINIEYEGDKYTPDEALRRAVNTLRELDAQIPD
ncbi:MAG: sugar phosphate isomerase/epimerase family protein [Planctomycetota bacterium]